MKKKMKIFLSFSLLFFLSVNCFAWSEGERRVNFDAGIATGYPFYGDKDLKYLNASVQNQDGGARFVIGVLADVNIVINKNFSFFAGCDFLTDNAINKTLFFNHLDLAFFPGIKFYPDLGGLNFSFAYATGRRFDFMRTPVENEVYDPAAWGNGFRLGVEYNFSYDSEYYWPSVGIYYRMMPRGSYNRDHILSIYCAFNF